MKMLCQLVLIVLCVHQNLGFPVILEGPSSAEVKLGSSVIFKCRTSSSDARIFWTHDGSQVYTSAVRGGGGVFQGSGSGSGSAQILSDGTLVIQNVAYTSEGVYACTVLQGDDTVVSRPAILTVQDRTQKPTISHRPIRTTVRVGDLIVLDCLARGYPPPHYTWYKDGGRLSPAHDRFNLAQNGSLIIDNAQLDDSAHYRCSASNYLGKASSSARVQVETSDPPSPPRITTRPRNKTVQEGGIIELTCVAQGSPYPTVTWWNNRRLVTSTSRVTLSNGGQHLRIQDIEIYDQGDYTCVAENILGKEQIVSVINVVPDDNPNRRGGRTRTSSSIRRPSTSARNFNRRTSPSAPFSVPYRSRDNSSRFPGTQSSREESRGRPDNHVETSILQQSSQPGSSRTLQSTGPTRASQPTRSDRTTQSTDTMKATLGSNIQLQCKMEEIRGHVMWEKDGNPIPWSSAGSHRLASDGSIFIYSVDPSDAGEYSCMDSITRERRMVAQLSIISQTLPIRPPTTGRFEASENSVLPEIRDNSQTEFHQHRVIQEESGSNAPGTGGLTSPQGLNRTPEIQQPTQYSVTERTVEDYEEEEDEDIRHETDLSYDVSGPSVGDQFVLVSLEEARRTVDRALNHTVELLFAFQQHTDRTPHQLLSIFRYPSGNDRELARAGEIYHRTLDLVEKKVAEGGNYNLTTFSIENLISPANLELIGNLSGCEAHRRHVDCEDVCFQTKYRSADGTCNNWARPLLGSSLTPFRRILKPQYENGFNTPIGHDPDRLYNGFPKPGARQISSTVISTSEVTMDSVLTSMLMQWGQFLDHDVGHSMESVSRETFRTGQTCGGSCENEPPCFPIRIPADDARIPRGSCMEFTRSAPSCGSGSTSVFFEKLQTREQVNQLTAFIDASQVYGNERTLALNLRNLTNSFGRLREGVTYDHGKPLLPFNDGHPIDCRRDPRESDIGCFLAGDIRANEQLGLLALHTVWFREHNRIAERFRELNPHWDGDTLYEEGRKLVGAFMQHITYKHWLPNIIGDEGMKMLGEYKGYNAAEDPSLSNVFSAAAFRFGHSLIAPILYRLNRNFTSIPEGDLSLHEAFFSPWRLVEEGGLDPILRGLFYSPAKMPVPGQTMYQDLTERLFEVAHTVALDLAALNIQRGRDHGLPPYTDWVETCGLGRIESWRDVTLIKNEKVLEKLKELYGHPGNIDLWVGGILEDLVDEGRVGPTFRCIIVEQFKHLRDGDRFWYENPGIFSSEQLGQIRQISLAEILCNNADDIRKIPENVFLNTEISNMVDCSAMNKFSPLPWKECVGDSLSVNSWSRTSNTGSSGSSDVGQLQQTVQTLQRRIQQLEESCPVHSNSEDDIVCVSRDGEVKEEGETWTIRSSDGCISCACKVGREVCSRTSC